jgi:hypothetical protein
MAKRKPDEELYDLKNDPFEFRNLSDSPEHQNTLKEMRGLLETWIKETGDKGQYPEKLEDVRRDPGFKRVKESLFSMPKSQK